MTPCLLNIVMLLVWMFANLILIKTDILGAYVKHRFIFALLMSFTLTLVMSAWITYLNIGLDPEFLSFWMHAWVLAWPVAGVVAFIAGPFLHKLAQKMVDRM